MVSPVRFYVESKLTGKLRVRRGWLNKLILQVEVSLDSRIGLKTEHDVKTKWRDAKESDVGLDFASLNIMDFVKKD
jgi:hypothetical protein